MAKKKTLLFTGILLLTVLLSGGLFFALAAGEGTATDPLITKSYIDKVFKPEIMGLIDSAVSEAVGTEAGDLQALIDDYETRINKKIDDFYTATGNAIDNGEYLALLNEAIREKLLGIEVTQSDDSQTFVLVTLASGETLECKTGCEMILRTGGAACVGGLLDIPASGELADGAALEANTLYMAGSDGKGLTATLNTTLLVRGGYTIN